MQQRPTSGGTSPWSVPKEILQCYWAGNRPITYGHEARQQHGVQIFAQICILEPNSRLLFFNSLHSQPFSNISAPACLNRLPCAPHFPTSPTAPIVFRNVHESRINVSSHRSHLLRQQQSVEHLQLLTPSYTWPLSSSHPTRDAAFQTHLANSCTNAV